MTMVPLGRVGGPDEIAQVAVLLASDDSSSITSIERFVDGGMAQIGTRVALRPVSRPWRTRVTPGIASR